MKRFCLFCAFVIICMSFYSCSENGNALLDYQNGADKVTAVFETSEGTFRIEISYTESGSILEIKEPENISGVCFSDENGTVSAISDNVKIPLSPSIASNLTPVTAAFRLPAENIVSITKDDTGNTVYTVSVENGVYTVSVNKEALPVSISYEGERTFLLTDIILQKNDLTTN